MKYTKQKMHKLQLKKHKKTKKNINKLKGGSLRSLRSLRSFFRKTEEEKIANINKQNNNPYIRIFRFILGLQHIDKTINITYFDLKIIILFIIVYKLFEPSELNILYNKLKDDLNIEKFNKNEITIKNYSREYLFIFTNLLKNKSIQQYIKQKNIEKNIEKYNVVYLMVNKDDWNEYTEFNKYINLVNNFFNLNDLIENEELLKINSESNLNSPASSLFEIFESQYKKLFNVNGTLVDSITNIDELIEKCNIMFYIPNVEPLNTTGSKQVSSKLQKSQKSQKKLVLNNTKKETSYIKLFKFIEEITKLTDPKNQECKLSYIDLKIIILFIIANDLLDDDKSEELKLKNRLIDYLNIDKYKNHINTGIFYRSIIKKLITDPIVTKYESYVLPDNFNISIDYSTLKDVKFNEHEEIDKYFDIIHISRRPLNDEKLSTIQQFINTRVIDFSNSNKSFYGFDRGYLFKMFSDNYKKIFNINGELNITPKSFEAYYKMMFTVKIDKLQEDNVIRNNSVSVV